MKSICEKRKVLKWKVESVKPTVEPAFKYRKAFTSFCYMISPVQYIYVMTLKNYE